MQRPWSRRAMLASIAGLAVAGASLAAQPVGYPRRAVKLLVGTPPGGPADFLARTCADGLAGVFGESFVVENRPGASGTLAADAAARAVPDGHTLLVTGGTAITTAPLLMKLGYDPATQLVPVSMLGAGAFVLVVNPALPARSVQDLIAMARSLPGALAFGSGGSGTSTHLTTALFGAAAGVRLTHVPYKGDAPALTDLVAGELQLMFTAPNLALPQVANGRLRALAVTSRERLPSMPHLPTLAEAGLKDFEALGWTALFAPAATPAPVLGALEAAWAKARASPIVRQRLEDLGMAAPERLAGREALAQFIRDESARVAKVIRDNGIKAD